MHLVTKTVCGWPLSSAAGVKKTGHYHGPKMIVCFVALFLLLVTGEAAYQGDSVDKKVNKDDSASKELLSYESEDNTEKKGKVELVEEAGGASVEEGHYPSSVGYGNDDPLKAKVHSTRNQDDVTSGFLQDVVGGINDDNVTPRVSGEDSGWYSMSDNSDTTQGDDEKVTELEDNTVEGSGKVVKGEAIGTKEGDAQTAGAPYPLPKAETGEKSSGTGAKEGDCPGCEEDSSSNKKTAKDSEASDGGKAAGGDQKKQKKSRAVSREDERAKWHLLLKPEKIYAIMWRTYDSMMKRMGIQTQKKDRKEKARDLLATVGLFRYRYAFRGRSCGREPARRPECQCHNLLSSR